MRLLSLVALLAAAAYAGSVSPSEPAPAPAQGPAPEAPASPTPSPGTPASATPASTPAPAPAPEAAPPAAASPEATLSSADLVEACTSDLAAGDYRAALTLALPAISTHPDVAKSLQACADIATDQLARDRERQEAAPVAATYPPRREPVRRTQPRAKAMWGMDVGAPSGLRLEWKIDRQAVDGLGFRVGGNWLMFEGKPYPSVDTSFYLDFKTAAAWQIETTTGLGFYYGYPLATIGAAIQYDPKGPFQAQGGARLSADGVMPDVGFGFLW